jgi:hypothetical protein
MRTSQSDLDGNTDAPLFNRFSGRTRIDAGAFPVQNPVMSITATIENGMIKLPKDVPWESGTVVRIEPVEEQSPTLLETLKEFDGIANDLPADLAANLATYQK